MRSRSFDSAAGLAIFVMHLFALTAPGSALATSYTWSSGVSGSISDASRWTPSGVPGVLDKLTFSPAGTYMVTFPASVPQTNMVTMSNGVVTFSATASHSTGGLAVSPNSLANSLSMVDGTFNINYLELGTSGFNSMTISSNSRSLKTATLHSNGDFNPHGGGDIVGYDGISELYVTSGGRYICETAGADNALMHMAELASSVSTLSISGAAPFFPQTVSSLQLLGGASLTVGVNGSANLFASNRGFIDVTGDMFVARGSSSHGYVTIGPGGSGTSYLEVHQGLYIGDNFDSGVGGHAELTVKDNAWVQVDGRCNVGDPQGSINGVIRVLQGGTFIVKGGFRFFSNTKMDLQGGLMHIKSGTYTLPDVVTISSQTGTPELRIEQQALFQPNSVHELYVGRSGSGLLHLRGTGFIMTSADPIVVGDSLGGNGTILQTGGAVVCGPVNVGVRGNGTWSMAGSASTGTVAVGAASGGVGQIAISGGAVFSTQDNLWIGGGSGGAGGTGTVTVGGSVLVYRSDSNNPPPLVTIYPSGTLIMNNKGQMVSDHGTVIDQGSIVLNFSLIRAGNIVVTGTGNLTGSGLLEFYADQLPNTLSNAGRVSPSTPTSPIGWFSVSGGFEQSSGGHYNVDLDTSGGQVSDIMSLSGEAFLGGTLDVTTLPGFAPSPGQTFPILFCSSRTGTFNTVTWNGQPLNGEATIAYETNVVNIVMPGVSGVGGPGSTSSVPAEVRFSAAGTREHPAFALDLPEAATVDVKVFDLHGHKVATLFEGALERGRRRFDFAHVARELASGTYFARAVIHSNTGTTTVKSARAIVVH
jgi:hypothetical protein